MSSYMDHDQNRLLSPVIKIASDYRYVGIKKVFFVDGNLEKRTFYYFYEMIIVDFYNGGRVAQLLAKNQLADSHLAESHSANRRLANSQLAQSFG